MYILSKACENPDILRLIYLSKKISSIIFIIIPIALIILIIMDLFKNVTNGDNDKTVKDNNKIVIKRLIYAVLLFFVPTIVSLIMNLLSLVGLTSEYKECIDNATKEKIEHYQEIQDNNEKNQGRGGTTVNKNGSSHSGGKF